MTKVLSTEEVKTVKCAIKGPGKDFGKSSKHATSYPGLLKKPSKEALGTRLSKHANPVVIHKR